MILIHNFSKKITLKSYLNAKGPHNHFLFDSKGKKSTELTMSTKIKITELILTKKRKQQKQYNGSQQNKNTCFFFFLQERK